MNPVEAREAALEEAETLELSVEEPKPVPVVEGLRELDEKGRDRLIREMGLAMSRDDLAMICDYFNKEEKRDPTVTEIRVLDTYWSDHCRHTTFSTRLEDISVEEGIYTKPVKKSSHAVSGSKESGIRKTYGKTGHPDGYGNGGGERTP